jgi:hypothetical protein
VQTKIPARKKPLEVIREKLQSEKVSEQSKLIIHNEILFMIYLKDQEYKTKIENYKNRFKNIEQKNKKLWIILILTTMVITSFSIIHF